MSSDSIITLYDVPSNCNVKAWSPNMWKARYVLNFKGVPYKTTWLEYPEIEPTMRDIGAAPTGVKPDGSPFYTLPVIVDPSRRTPSGGPTIVSESFLIAEYLDEAYPTPGPLFPAGTKALQKLFYDHFFPTALMPVLPILLPEMLGHVNERSRPYWRRTRELRLGAVLEEICPKDSEKWDKAWEDVQKGMKEIALLLDKNGFDSNGLVMGQHLTFADLTIAAFLETIFIVNPEEWHAKVKVWDGGRWERLRERCAAWRSIQ
ncbi:hypothetical protein K439DRAFT_1630524 [Ramaria rubella]|nr:hypothetical protein K439DRAFT_1630524 [Ramaria rubella]